MNCKKNFRLMLKWTAKYYLKLIFKMSYSVNRHQIDVSIQKIVFSLDRNGSIASSYACFSMMIVFSKYLMFVLILLAETAPVDCRRLGECAAKAKDLLILARRVDFNRLFGRRLAHWLHGHCWHLLEQVGLAILKARSLNPFDLMSAAGQEWGDRKHTRRQTSCNNCSTYRRQQMQAQALSARCVREHYGKFHVHGDTQEGATMVT